MPIGAERLRTLAIEVLFWPLIGTLDLWVRQQVCQVAGIMNQCWSEEMVYHTIPYHTIPYHTIPYHTIPYHTIPYRTAPHRTVPYRTVPYRTVPYRTAPYRTIPYRTVPNHTIPYHTRIAVMVIDHVVTGHHNQVGGSHPIAVL